MPQGLKLEPTFHSRIHVLVGLSQKFIVWQETKSSRLKWDLDTSVKSSVDVCIPLPGCSHLESLEGVSASELLDRSLGQV